MKLLILLFIVGCAVAYPRSYNRRSYNAQAARLQTARLQTARLQPAFVRPRRAPIQRAMLISGYYRPYRPLIQRRQGLESETAMTAFAAGDSVAAGSYLGSNLGPNCVSCDPAVEQDNTEFLGAPEADPVQFESENPTGDFPEAPLGLAPVADAPFAEEAEAIQPVNAPKRKPNKIADDDDDEEQDTFPVRKTKGSHSYFPIMFGGYPGARSGSSGSGGGVTAIANSYSTGKGGVATSHATAYGGAPPRSNKKGVAQEEDE